MGYLHEVANDLKPDIIRIDPVSAYLTGDLTKDEILGPWLSEVRQVGQETDTAIILNSHTPKDHQPGHITVETQRLDVCSGGGQLS